MKFIRNIFLFLFVFLCFLDGVFAQTSINEAVREVSTIGTLDTNRTKSGYRINKYYVELEDSLFNIYKGKRIEVSGKLLTVKAIDKSAKEIEQGALHDRLFIIEPQITIIYDTREPLKKD